MIGFNKKKESYFDHWNNNLDDFWNKRNNNEAPKYRRIKRDYFDDNYFGFERNYSFNKYWKRAELSALHTNFGAVKFSEEENETIAKLTVDIYDKISKGLVISDNIKDIMNVVIPDIISSFYSNEKEYELNKYNKDWIDILCKIDFKAYGYLTKNNLFFTKKFSENASRSIIDFLLKGNNCKKTGLSNISTSNLEIKQKEENQNNQNNQSKNNQDSQDSQDDQNNQNNNGTESNNQNQSEENKTQENQNSGNQNVSSEGNNICKGSSLSKSNLSKSIINNINNHLNSEKGNNLFKVKNILKDFDNSNIKKDESVKEHEESSSYANKIKKQKQKEDEKQYSEKITEQFDKLKTMEDVYDNIHLFNKKSNFKKLIDKTLYSITNAFIPSKRQIEESIFDSESFDGLIDYSYLIDPLDKLAHELKTRDYHKSMKFDIYIDMSGSMTSNINNISYDSFSKQCFYKLMKNNLIEKLYIFENDVYSCLPKDYLFMKASGGTRIDSVYKNIIKNNRPSIILTDADDSPNMVQFSKKGIKKLIDNSFIVFMTNNIVRNELLLFNKADNFSHFIDKKKFVNITSDGKLYMANEIVENGRYIKVKEIK